LLFFDFSPILRGGDMKTLLLIDDDAVFRSTLKRLLCGQGWEVLEAEDGDSALSTLLERRPRI
jgi:ActR/RegA family two-component response regulator